MTSLESLDGLDTGADREQRHCPECGALYECRPGWRPAACPTCNGKRISKLKANPAADITPPLRADPVPAEMTELERELLAMQLAGRCLEPLDTASRARVLAWLWARYDTEGTHV